MYRSFFTTCYILMLIYIILYYVALCYQRNSVRPSVCLSHAGVVCVQEKCYQYWPSERSARYQYFVVDPLAEYNMPHYVLREFKVTDARVS